MTKKPTEQNLKDRKDADDLRCELQGQHQNSTPSFPVIEDIGPPTARRYSNPDVFWNSVMVEGSRDYTPRSKLSPLRFRPNTKRTKSFDATDIQTKKEARYPDDARENAVGNHKQSLAQVTRAQEKKYNEHGFQRPKCIRAGKESANNDLVVMYHDMPEYINPYLTPLRQEETKDLSPAKRRSDEVLDRTRPLNCSKRCGHHLAVIHEVPNLQQALPDGRSSSHLSSHTPQDLKCPTLNSRTNHILNHEADESEAKDVVTEWVDGSSEGLEPPVSTKKAVHKKGLEVDTEYETRHLVVAHATHSLENLEIGLDIEYRTSLTTVGLRGGIEEDVGQDRRTATVISASNSPVTSDDAHSLPNSISSSCNNAYLSHDRFYDNTSPLDDVVTKQIHSLLREVLSKSEINLCHQIVEDAPTATLQPMNLLPPGPQQIKQAKTAQTLLPQLGIALEKKTYTIGTLSVKIQNLGDEVRELGAVVDFGNKVLAGCWIRDHEMWRTLAALQEKRRLKHRKLLRRLTGRLSRVVSEKMREGEWPPYRNAEASPSKPYALTKRELDALTDMANQNVDIVKEDIDDMVARLLVYKEKFKASPAVERMKGSWRDV
ncbi:hypothetical protein GQ44DRAFT_766148 [Phaeosphaeriaceae sp. PMI808]|nr:hypothetical protein GQ44DRAFT_766148 [Phaeosphaeriaceae sp. PMI808]